MLSLFKFKYTFGIKVKHLNFSRFFFFYVNLVTIYYFYVSKGSQFTTDTQIILVTALFSLANCSQAAVSKGARINYVKCKLKPITFKV